MSLALTILGLVLVAVGVVFLRWPTILRRGMWMHTSIAIRSFSESNYVWYMRVVGAFHVVAGAAVLVVALVSPSKLVEFWSARVVDHRPARDRVDVIVDSTVSAENALHVGENPRAPRENTDTSVRAKRDPDGTLVVDVCVRRNEFWFVSRFVLRGEPGHVECDVTSHSAQGDSTRYRWPSRDLRGSLTLNHDHLRDLAGRPLILHSDVTGWRSGSDVHEALTIAITEADLR